MNYTIIFLLVLFAAGGVVFYLLQRPMSVEENEDVERDSSDTEERADQELVKEILKEGSGPEVDFGDEVVVHYVGTLEDGTKFDSSRDRGQPFSFVQGQGAVIQGWEQGVIGMKVGEIRKLYMAPSLGYGERGVPGAIPPNSSLVFEIELLEINP